MKKIITFFMIVFLAVVFISCRKCVTCTESNTKTKSNYCGTSKNVNIYEETLKSKGAEYGQSWTCIDDN